MYYLCSEFDNSIDNADDPGVTGIHKLCIKRLGVIPFSESSISHCIQPQRFWNFMLQEGATRWRLKGMASRGRI